jgi:hypothetical protein
MILDLGIVNHIETLHRVNLIDLQVFVQLSTSTLLATYFDNLTPIKAKTRHLL